jgi:DNA-directed RNA polymerase subunit RPC12/RpoP
MDRSEIGKLVEKAKQGDTHAKDAIVRLIQDNGYIKIISRYLYANRLIEPDEVRGEFWLGVVLALPTAKPDIGDPLHYLAWQGLNRIKNRMRSKILKGTFYQCIDCDHEGRLHKIRNKETKQMEFRCNKCGSIKLRTWQREVNETVILKRDSDTESNQTTILETFLPIPPNQREIDVKIDMEIIKNRLTKQERRVFTMIVDEQIDRDHEENYLQTIANRMGVTSQCINAYLKKIRNKMDFMRRSIR